MSRKLFAFLLAELKTVRITCPHCKGVVEVTPEQLGYRFDSPECPVCRKPWAAFAGGSDGHLARLGKAIQAIQGIGAAEHIEFVLPDPS